MSRSFLSGDDMEMFLDSFIDESTFLKGILDGGDDPFKIIENFSAIDRHEDFRSAVRVRQLLS